MRRLIHILAFVIFAAPLAQPLHVNAWVVPSPARLGQEMMLLVQVQNISTTTMSSVSPTVDLQAGSVGQVTYQSGPSPVSAYLPPSNNVTFTYIYSADTCGALAFSAGARGVEEGTLLPVQAVPDVVTAVIDCGPPATPTPLPAEAEAEVRGNVLRPGGPPMEFHYALTIQSRVHLRVYNRNGSLLRTLREDSPAGRHMISWDGRGDDGALLGAGIYVAHLQAKGLNQRFKIAVIR